MSIYAGNQKLKKLNIGNQAVRKAYLGNQLVYSAGNIVTYHVDAGVRYQEEVDEGESCLSPKTFTPQKAGWTFVGWRMDMVASGDVLASKVMGDNPVTLYAVFTHPVTVTYYNGSASASAQMKNRHWNNGNDTPPSFTLTQAAKSGWSARGWSTSTAANGGITYATGAAFTRNSDVTLYGMYQQTIALTTVANGSSSTQYGTRYYNSNGNIINPVFTVSTPSLSGANWLGWCNSAGTVLYSSISNLALSESITLYSKFKWNDVTYTYGQIFFRNGRNGGADYGNPAYHDLTSGIDLSKYSRYTFYTGSAPGSRIGLTTSSDYYWTGQTASCGFRVNGAYPIMNTIDSFGGNYTADDENTKNITGRYITNSISIGGSATFVLKGEITGGTGFSHGFINCDGSPYLNLTGKTVIG